MHFDRRTYALLLQEIKIGWGGMGLLLFTSLVKYALPKIAIRIG